MKLCGIIIVYFPDYEKLRLNISSVMKEIDQLIVWDNTPDASILDVELKDFLDEIIIMSENKNLGIGAALNKGVEWAFKNKFTHILTLDQDSCFLPKNFDKYKEIVNRITNNNNLKIGIFAPNLLCNDVLEYDQKSNETMEVPDAITSGSIFPLKVFRECGVFNEEMFIDAVDYEFCCRIKAFQNYKTVVCPEIILNHNMGYVTKTKLGIKLDNYSSFRTYHIIRNHIMLWKAYPKTLHNRHKKHLIVNSIIKKTIKVILFETDKISKIKSVCTGIYDGLFKKNLINPDMKKKLYLML